MFTRQSLVLCVLGLSIRAAVGASSISGTVTGPGGSFLPYVQVTAYRNEGSYYNWYTSVTANATGQYAVTGLPAGQYKIEFDNEDCLIEYYNNKAQLDDADTITLGDSVVITDIDAALAPGATVSGTVTGPGGGALDGIQVTAYVNNGYYYAWYRAAMTVDGAYSIRGLPAGPCRIEFRQWEGTYATSWYIDTPYRDSASTIVVPALATVSSINAALVYATRIRGLVTAATGATPLSGIYVAPYRWNGVAWREMDGTGTEQDGSYDLRGLLPGQYILYFRDWQGLYAPQYYSNALTEAEAASINAAVSITVSNIDASLADGSSIGGTVTAIGGTPAVFGMLVTAYRWNGSDWDWFSTAQTDGAGAYQIGGLPAGTYHIFFEGSASYVGIWYDNQSSQQSATDILLTTGEARTNVNAALSSGAHITGHIVSDAGGSPLSNIYVYAELSLGSGTWTYARSAESDAAGNYDIAGLSPGTYRVAFAPTDGAYMGEWFDDQTIAELASNLIVVAGATVSNIDAVLSAAARIRGTVTDSEGHGLKDISVELYVWNGATWNYIWATSSASDGSYTIGPLMAGMYRIRFSDPAGNFQSEYYDNAASANDATTITLADAETRDGVNAALDATLASGISGTITDIDTGDAIAFIQAIACTNAGTNWNAVGYAMTDGDGFYEIQGLPPGTYRVVFYDLLSRGYLPQWWANAPDAAKANDIVVFAGTVTPHIDAELSQGAPTGISGLVTASDGVTPLSNITVTAYIFDPDFESWTLTDWTDTGADGSYALTQLPPGTYHLFFDGDAERYFSEWYDDTQDASSAFNLSVDDGTMTTGIVASLTRYASIAGTLTYSDGVTPLPGKRAQLEMWDGVDWQWRDNVLNDQDGRYCFDELRAGQYRVWFYDSMGRFADEWYDDQPDGDDALPITLAEGQDQTGINAALAMTVAPGAPQITGFNRMTNSAWEVQFNGEPEVLYRLQGAASLSDSWDDVGAGTSGVFGANGLCWPESGDPCFLRVKATP